MCKTILSRIWSSSSLKSRFWRFEHRLHVLFFSLSPCIGARWGHVVHKVDGISGNLKRKRRTFITYTIFGVQKWIDSPKSQIHDYPEKWSCHFVWLLSLWTKLLLCNSLATAESDIYRSKQPNLISEDTISKLLFLKIFVFFIWHHWHWHWRSLSLYLHRKQISKACVKTIGAQLDKK